MLENQPSRESFFEGLIYDRQVEMVGHYLTHLNRSNYLTNLTDQDKDAKIISLDCAIWHIHRWKEGELKELI